MYLFIYLLPYGSFNGAVMSSNSIVSNVHNEFESIMEGAILSNILALAWNDWGQRRIRHDKLRHIRVSKK